MTEATLYTTTVREACDVQRVRERTRQLAALLGYDALDQVAIATAVSEIARNACEHAGGGELCCAVPGDGTCTIRVSDRGPGIADLPGILAGRSQSRDTPPHGILSARGLMDRVEFATGAGGTTVTLAKALPAEARALPARELEEMGRSAARAAPLDPLAELQIRNRELLVALDELQGTRLEVERLNGELTETNRGVLALYAELDDRALQLGRASELKSNFLSSISHELRTPLNAIRNLTRLLLDRMDGDLSANQEHQVQLIQSAAVTLSDMVNDLLDLARIEAGKTVLRVTEFTVAELLGALRGMARPLISGDAVALVVDQPRWTWQMRSDEGKLSQVLRNLVSNAIKFTPQGEIRVTAAYDEAHDMVTIAVSDTGIGIAPDDLERIFEEYAQVDSALQRRSIGTGLGLPLSRKLAALLGGSLSALSEPGVGSTFILRVPRRCPEERSDQAAASGPTTDHG
jgi:signal transduction histidine kinase